MKRLIILLITLIIVSGCGVIVRGVQTGVTDFVNSTLFHQGRHGELTKQEKEWAKIAWKFFEKNYNPATGVTNITENYPSASLWQFADTIAATIAAREIGLIDDYKFDNRISQLLGFLNYMELSFGKLPNKIYNIADGKMSDYGNKPGDIGWSAIDIGRLLIWLKILADYAPRYSEYIDKAILRWSFCEVIDDCGNLYGSARQEDGKIQLYNESRMGYEEYALMGYAAWGFRVRSQVPYEATIKLFGINVPHDKRDPRKTGNYSPVVSTPYILHGMEFWWRGIEGSADTYPIAKQMKETADKVYRVQAARYEQERIFTARTDHPISEKPYFLYDSIYAGGYSWNTITDDGTPHQGLALVSTRAAFGLWVLWKTPYTDQLMSLINTLYDAEHGWFEGRYEHIGAHERTYSCSTNAMVLQALYYKMRGKLYHVAKPKTHAQVVLSDEFRRPRCSPPEREMCKIPYR